MTTSSSSKPSLNNSLLIAFFGFLIFLCCADRFFAVRLHDYNFRIGQLLLLLGVLPIALHFFNKPKASASLANWRKIALNWVPFLLAYTIAAIASPDPKHTFLKLGWVVFNLGCASLLFIGSEQWASLKKGTVIGLALVALFISVQFIAIYGLGMFDWFTFLKVTPTDSVPWYHNLLGFAQPAGSINSIPIFRPHAFYYEPSYAGCALTLAFPLCIAFFYRKRGNNWKEMFIPALLLTAVALTTARSAIAGIGLGGIFILAACVIKKRYDLLKSISKAFVITALIFAAFAPLQYSSKYFLFFENIIAPNGIMDRVGDEDSSEGWRVFNTRESIRLWLQSPIVGNGVLPLSEKRGLHGLGQTAQSMWLEILVGVRANHRRGRSLSRLRSLRCGR